MSSNIEDDFLEYYKCLKQLVSLHKKNEFGKNPPIPEVFSEKLCRHLCNLIPSNTRDFDANTVDNNKIEIKATGTETGTTTINLNVEIDDLYWLVFDFDSDELKITKIPKATLPKPKPEIKRSSITLSNFTNGCNIKIFDLGKTPISEKP